jgi:hypothetical protein
MDAYILFFTAIAVALGVLAIYISEIEHLAKVNQNRITQLTVHISEIGRTVKAAQNKISESATSSPVLGSIESALSKALEENKSLAFQLAEVSKALQEKKSIIYEMDGKISRLDARALKAEKELSISNRKHFISEGEELKGFDGAHLHDHSGPDSIFEINCKDADWPVKLNFEPAGEPSSVRLLGGKIPNIQNLPKPAHFKWWQSLSDTDVEKLQKAHRFNFPAELTLSEIKEIWEIEKENFPDETE